MATVGDQLSALRDRSGLTLNEVATAASYRGRSSVQKFFAPDYDPPFLDMSVAKRLARAFVGRGRPEITESDIFELTESQAQAGKDYQYQVGAPLKKDVAVYLATFVRRSEIMNGQVPLSTYFIELDNPVLYAWHPPALTGNRGIYGLRIQKNPLVPKFMPGECIFLDSVSPPRLGDDVCLYYDEFDTPPSQARTVSSGALVLFGTLERHTVEALHFRTIDGSDTFYVNHDEAKAVHRIITLTSALVA